jgi:hypothetical protein
MSIEHRRQLLAFFIVACAAVLLIGNALHNQSLDPFNARARSPEAIAAAVTITPGESSVESGGSARGTTAAPAPVSSVATSGGTSTSGTTSPVSTGPGRSEQAPKAQRAAQKSNASAQTRTGQRTTQGNARTAYRSDSVTGDDTLGGGHGKKAHAKKHGKKQHRH